MSNENNLEFLKIYIKLDELCKQVLSSDRGVSEYIDEMDKESQGYQIAGWKADYKKLKQMRWIRNRLVHETDSFENELAKVEDIEWLHKFYCRIMECSDPFSLLYQLNNKNRKTSTQGNCPEIHFLTNDEIAPQNNDLQSKDSFVAGMVLAGIILIAIIIIFILIFVFLAFK